MATSAIWTHLGGSTNNGDPGAGNCVNTGHFRRVLWHPDPSECIIRNIFNSVPGTQQASRAQLNNDRTGNPNYEDFRQQTEAGGNRHNTLHNRFGFPSDMRSGESPRDPLFYFVSAVPQSLLSIFKSTNLCSCSTTVSLTSCGTIGRRYTEMDHLTTQLSEKSTISTLPWASSLLHIQALRYCF